jgi:hypothetical protein
VTRKLTRRRLARLAVAGGVAVGSIGVVTTSFATTILARTSPNSLIGIMSGPAQPDDGDRPAGDITEFEPGSGGSHTANAAVPITVHALDLSTGRSRALTAPFVRGAGQSPLLTGDDSIGGCAALADGTVVLAITPGSASNNRATATRLTRLTTPVRSIGVAGLRQTQQLSDLVATSDGRLLGLITQRSGSLPAFIVEVDPQRGQQRPITTLAAPGYWRISTLAESPDGQIHATAITREGETHVVRVDTRQGGIALLFPLTLNENVWNNGLQSLVYSTTGGPIALGAPRYESTNALYRIDGRGAMIKLYDFDAIRIAMSPA